MDWRVLPTSWLMGTVPGPSIPGAAWTAAPIFHSQRGPMGVGSLGVGEAGGLEEGASHAEWVGCLPFLDLGASMENAANPQLLLGAWLPIYRAFDLAVDDGKKPVGKGLHCERSCFL